MAERQAARQSPGVGGPEDFADVRAILRWADNIGVDLWRVLVALGVPTDVRESLLEAMDGDEGDSPRKQPSGADDAG